jgi:hypothetical protein
MSYLDLVNGELCYSSFLACHGVCRLGRVISARSGLYLVLDALSGCFRLVWSFKTALLDVFISRLVWLSKQLVWTRDSTRQRLIL